MYQIHLADTNSASFQLHSRCPRCARSYISRLYETERRLNLYLQGVYLIHMFLGVFRPLDVKNSSWKRIGQSIVSATPGKRHTTTDILSRIENYLCESNYIKNNQYCNDQLYPLLKKYPTKIGNYQHKMTTSIADIFIKQFVSHDDKMDAFFDTKISCAVVFE